MRHRVSSLVLLMMFFVVIGVIVGIYPNMFLIVVTALGGWLGVVLQVMYNKWDRLYLFVQYLRSFFYPDTLWDFTVEYTAKPSKELSVESLQSRMADSMTDVKLRLVTLETIEFRWQGITGQIIALNDEKYQVHLLDVRVSKWKTEEMMNGEIQRIFDVVEIWMKPDTKRFYFTVRFDEENNPYFGLYLRRIAKADVINFDVTIQVADNKVELNKDKLTIIAPTFGEIRTLSKKYLLLSVAAS